MSVAEMSEYFRVRLLPLEFDRPAAVRIQGLAIGIDVGSEDYADAITSKGRATSCWCRAKDRPCCSSLR